MAHFAEIDAAGTVLRVCQFRDGATPEEISTWLGGTWVQTSYNTRGGIHYGADGQPDEGTPLRKNYAGIGFAYDTQRGAFIPPQPYPSWLLDESTCQWAAPVPMPIEGGPWVWNEPTTSWGAI